MQNSTLLDTIKQLPAVKEILGAAERDLLGQRQAKIDTWHDMQAADRAKLRQLDEAHKEAAAQADKAEKEFRRLDLIRRESIVALQAFSNKARSRDDAAREEIKFSADRRIHAFALWARRAENLANFASHSAMPMAHEGIISSQAADASEQSRRVSSLVNAAVDRADAMALEAIAEADMLAELAQLADGIRDAFAPLGRFVPGRLPTDHFSYV